jgi:hypothetical protein
MDRRNHVVKENTGSIYVDSIVSQNAAAILYIDMKMERGKDQI